MLSAGLPVGGGGRRLARRSWAPGPVPVGEPRRCQRHVSASHDRIDGLHVEVRNYAAAFCDHDDGSQGDTMRREVVDRKRLGICS